MGHYALFGIQEEKKELENGDVGGGFIIIENENVLPRDQLPRSFCPICVPCETTTVTEFRVHIKARVDYNLINQYSTMQKDNIDR